MTVFLLFGFFLLLENLFLPALLGPGTYFIIPIFILGLLAYSKNIKIWIFQALAMLFLEELFTGTGVGKLVLPVAITAVMYLWLNRFVNLNDQFRDELSPAGLALSTATLGILAYIFSGIGILIDNLSFYSSWTELKLFFINSYYNVFGWSAVISLLFKFLKK